MPGKLDSHSFEGCFKHCDRVLEVCWKDVELVGRLRLKAIPLGIMLRGIIT